MAKSRFGLLAGIIAIGTGLILLSKKVTGQGTNSQDLKTFISADKTSGDPPLVVNFTASAINAIGSVQYKFDFGDGPIVNFGASRTAQHTYQNQGTFTTKVDARDSGNHAATASVQITVGNAQAKHSASISGISVDKAVVNQGDTLTLSFNIANIGTNADELRGNLYYYNTVGSQFVDIVEQTNSVAVPIGGNNQFNWFLNTNTDGKYDLFVNAEYRNGSNWVLLDAKSASNLFIINKVQNYTAAQWMANGGWPANGLVNVGQQLNISAQFKNSGTTVHTFHVTLGFIKSGDGWFMADGQNVSLNPGETKTINWMRNVPAIEDFFGASTNGKTYDFEFSVGDLDQSGDWQKIYFSHMENAAITVQ